MGQHVTGAIPKAGSCVHPAILGCCQGQALPWHLQSSAACCSLRSHQRGWCEGRRCLSRAAHRALLRWDSLGLKSSICDTCWEVKLAAASLTWQCITCCSWNKGSTFQMSCIAYGSAQHLRRGSLRHAACATTGHGSRSCGPSWLAAATTATQSCHHVLSAQLHLPREPSGCCTWHFRLSPIISQAAVVSPHMAQAPLVELLGAQPRGGAQACV